jgi:hypothetical protein
MADDTIHGLWLFVDHKEKPQRCWTCDGGVLVWVAFAVADGMPVIHQGWPSRLDEKVVPPCQREVTYVLQFPR